MIFPLQWFGCGDVIFTQTLIRNLGDQILWPVNDMFVEGLSFAYPDVNFVPYTIFSPSIFNIKEKKKIGDLEIAPIRWAETILKLPYTECMRAKYLLYDQDYKLWKVNAVYKRDLKREKLLYDSLNLPAEYNLISPTFGTTFKGKMPIMVNNGLANIEMKFIKGYSIFDWSLVLESATEIHVVSSAILYILELLDLKQPIHLYPRMPQEHDFRNVEYLFTKPYILHL